MKEILSIIKEEGINEAVIIHNDAFGNEDYNKVYIYTKKGTELILDENFLNYYEFIQEWFEEPVRTSLGYIEKYCKYEIIYKKTGIVVS